MPRFACPMLVAMNYHEQATRQRECSLTWQSLKSVAFLDRPFGAYIIVATDSNDLFTVKL